MRLFRNAFTLAVLAGSIHVAHAADGQTNSSIKLSGFGTIGAAVTDTDLAEFTTFGQVRGASKTPSFEPDTKLGVQVDGTLNNTFSGTMQLQTAANASGSWNPSLVLAFGKAKLGSMFSARAGRLGIPFFLVSDFRNVGYANVWLRSPLAVYGQVPIQSFDGADLQFQKEVGDAVLSAQLYGGNGDTKARSATAKFKRMIGLNASAQFGLLTVRVGHATSSATVKLDQLQPLLAGLRSIGSIPLPQFAEMNSTADSLETIDVPSSFSGIGASYEGNHLVINTEYTRRKTGGVIPSTAGWYLNAGYRFGNWTPYATTARLKQTSPTSSSAVPTVESLGPAAGGLPPEVLGALPSLSSGLNALLASVGQKSTGIGFRWDAMKNLAVKVQFDRITVDSGIAEGGGFTSVKPGFGEKPVNVFSAAVDFVF